MLPESRAEFSLPPSAGKERHFHNLPVRAVILNLKYSQGKLLRKGHKVPVLTTYRVKHLHGTHFTGLSSRNNLTINSSF